MAYFLYFAQPLPFFIQPGFISRGTALLTVGWDLPYQLSVKKMSQDILQDQSDGGISSVEFLLPGYFRS